MTEVLRNRDLGDEHVEAYRLLDEREGLEAALEEALAKKYELLDARSVNDDMDEQRARRLLTVDRQINDLRRRLG